jgi:hypothetical protein
MENWYIDSVRQILVEPTENVAFKMITALQNATKMSWEHNSLNTSVVFQLAGF